MLTIKLFLFVCFLVSTARSSKMDFKNETSSSIAYKKDNDNKNDQDGEKVCISPDLVLKERIGGPRREMKARYSGSRYSGSSSSYRGSSSYSYSAAKRYYSGYSASSYSYKSTYSPTSKYTYSYSRYKNPTSYSNSYYSVSTKRTSRPLYVYYRAPNYYNAIGYYSTVFLIVYYDGYGYNFYYGRYGYYEYSVNQRPESSAGSAIGSLIGCLCCCIVVGVVVYLFKKGSKGIDVDE